MKGGTGKKSGAQPRRLPFLFPAGAGVRNPFCSAAAFGAASAAARGRLARDLAVLEKSALEDLIFRPETPNFGARMAAFLETWKEPSAAALALFCADRLGIGKTGNTQDFAALAVAGVLAGIENALPYHGNGHYKKVLLLAARHIVTHNRISPPQDRFSPHQAALVLTAALVHDLAHDGKGNGAGDTHAPFRLEQKAADIARPFLKEAGLPEEDIRDIETMILCTDVTPMGDPAAPARSLERLYRGEDTALPERLTRLRGRPDLVRMAMVLETADIALSSGLSFERGMAEAVLLAKETGIAAIGTAKAFFNFASGPVGAVVTLTPAGRKLYGAGYAAILKEGAIRAAMP